MSGGRKKIMKWTRTCGKITLFFRRSWLNYALRDEKAVYWVSLGHYEAVAVGN